MNKNKLFLAIVVISALGILAFEYKDSKPVNNKEHAQSLDSAKPLAANEIQIKNYAFSPAKINVKKGTKITWENYDLAPHTVTMDDSTKEGPTSEIFGKGKKFSYTFSKAGTYKYHCEPHPYMKAEVIVSE